MPNPLVLPPTDKNAGKNYQNNSFFFLFLLVKTFLFFKIKFHNVLSCCTVGDSSLKEGSLSRSVRQLITCQTRGIWHISTFVGTFQSAKKLTQLLQFEKWSAFHFFFSFKFDSIHHFFPCSLSRTCPMFGFQTSSLIVYFISFLARLSPSDVCSSFRFIPQQWTKTILIFPFWRNKHYNVSDCFAAHCSVYIHKRD